MGPFEIQSVKQKDKISIRYRTERETFIYHPTDKFKKWKEHLNSPKQYLEDSVQILFSHTNYHCI